MAITAASDNQTIALVMKFPIKKERKKSVLVLKNVRRIQSIGILEFWWMKLVFPYDSNRKE